MPTISFLKKNSWLLSAAGLGQLFGLFFGQAVAALTFETHALRDSVQPNYLRFHDPINDHETFETLAADFNGDGFADILSLGGLPDNWIMGVVFVTPINMMLYDEQSKDYVPHDLHLNITSSAVNVVDIDKDGDLDIVTLAGAIFINDSHANFSQISFNSVEIYPGSLFTLDWDSDGDIDIVNPNKIFLNDGNLDFSQEIAMPTAEIEGPVLFYVGDLNNDSRPDLLYYNDFKIISMLSDEAGVLQLHSVINTSFYAFKLQVLDKNSATPDFILSSLVDGFEKPKILKNDAQGGFIAEDFNLDTDDSQFERLHYEKFYLRDLNNDGTDELVIALNYRNQSDCSNRQNLILIYNNVQGSWVLDKKFHSDGYAVDPGLYSYYFGSVLTPDIIDLNHDGLLDIVMHGDKPIVWLAYQHGYDDGYDYYLSNSSKMQYTTSMDMLDYVNIDLNRDGKVDILNAISITSTCSAPNDFLYSPSAFSGSILWVNDGDNIHYHASSAFAGGLDFFGAFDYVKFVDVFNNGTPLFLATKKSSNQQSDSRIYDGRSFEPVFSFALPESTYNAQTAQLDTRSQRQEIITIANTQQAPLIIYALEDGQTTPLQIAEITRLEFGNKNGEFKLADMDNNGTIDIIANSKAANNAISIWYNDGNSNFTQGQSFGNNSKSIAVLDANNDGKLDVLTANETHDIFVQQADNHFENLVYDDSFWHTPVGAIEDYSQNWIPSNLQVKDINNDGKDDLIAYYSSVYHVYINESNAEHVWFYVVSSSNAGANPNTKEVFFQNTNNDNLTDYSNFDGSTIQFHTQGIKNVTTGLFYDSEFSGHGYTIEDIGTNNLFYTVFYTYDDSGKPQWFSSLNRYSVIYDKYQRLSPVNRQNAIRFIYDYTNQVAVMDDASEYTGSLLFSSNSFGNAINSAFYNIGGQSDRWHVHPIVKTSQKPANDPSGLWWAGRNDAGWGISLSFVQRESSTDVVAIVYFYDELGEPRWLIGNGNNFAFNQNITLNMKQINGYGRQQNYVELTEIDAGTITLNLKQASQDLSQAGTLSMNIRYPDDINNHNYWQRDEVPIALFSKPRN